MRRTLSVLACALAMLVSGCTVAHFTYIRNLSESDVQLTFVFDQDAAPSLRDSMFVPSSPTAHLVNNSTYTFMTDSLIAKKIGMTTLKMSFPSGAMIMIDKNTSRKVGYHDPSQIEVAIPVRNVKYTLVNSAPTDGQKQLKSKGSYGHIHWHDIY